MISQLTEEEKKRGVIACSAGNHAQGVALAATKYGIKSLIDGRLSDLYGCGYYGIGRIGLYVTGFV